MITRVLSLSFFLIALSTLLPANATQNPEENKASHTKETTQPEQNKPELEPEEVMTAPFVTNASITGDYYFAHENFIRDVYVTTPLNGKFYFRVFVAQTPIKNGMTIQYYNDVDGVATFTTKGMGVYRSPFKNCNLYFFFKPPRLIIQQEHDCGMSSDLGFEPRGSYKQIESF